MRIGGGLRGASHSWVLRASVALILSLVISISVSACGNSASGPTPSDPPNNLVTREEVNKEPQGSVQRAFLEFWSALQFQSWAEVAAYYAPPLREEVGTASIIGASKVNGSSFPQLKPSIVAVKTDRGPTTINYSLRFLDGTKELASISWRKHDGNWEVVFDSRLDAELNQFAENDVELEKNGTLPTELSAISPGAARAGSVAGQAQARSVERELEGEAP